MSSLHTTAVRERLNALEAEGHKTAAQVGEYVELARDDTAARERARPSTEALLTAIRLDEGLALEIQDSMGRDVVAALTDDRGVVRYPIWSHSAPNATAPGEDIRTVAAQRYASAESTVDERHPLVVLRDSTPLAEIQAPDDWQTVDGPGDLDPGP